MPSSSVWERSTQRSPATARRKPVDPPRHALLRAVAVGVLEDVYDAGAGLQPGGMLFARPDVVGLTGLVGIGLAIDGEVQAAAHDDAPLGAVGVRGHLEVLGGAEEDRLSVGTRDHVALESGKGRIDLREVLDPTCKRVHRGSSPTALRTFARGAGVIILGATGCGERGG